MLACLACLPGWLALPCVHCIFQLSLIIVIMTDTTNIDDLPSGPHSSQNNNVAQNNIVLDKQETSDYQSMISKNNLNNNTAINNAPTAIENQKMMNELVSGIQQASASGATRLPSRDIPMNTSNIVQDPQITPNYVSSHPNDDYIAESENMNDYLMNNIKSTNKQDSIEILLESIQGPIMLGLLYFLFQLPVVKTFIFNIFPALFKSDGNQNLGGYLFFSVLFATIYFIIHMCVNKLEMM